MYPLVPTMMQGTLQPAPRPPCVAATALVGAWMLGDRSVALPERLARLLPAAGAVPDSQGARTLQHVSQWHDVAHGIALRALCQAPVQAIRTTPDSRYVALLEGTLVSPGGAGNNAPRCTPHDARDALQAWLSSLAAAGMRDALPELEGAFAMAVYDRERHQLTLLRDRAGQRSLYYAWVDGTLFFASQPTVLARHPIYERRVDRRVLALYLRHGYVPAPHSMFAGMYQLLPGCMMQLDLAALRRGGEAHLPGLAQQSWWNARQVLEQRRAPRRMAETLLAPAAASARLDHHLQSSIAARRGSGRCAALLSGGVASSLVAAVLQSQCSQPVPTVCVGFDDDGAGELRWAEAMARGLGVDHVATRLDGARARDLVQQLPAVWCEPFADAAQLPALAAFELLDAGQTVVSGAGGDALWPAHGRHAGVVRSAVVASRVPGWVRALARGGLRNDPECARLGGMAGVLSAVASEEIRYHALQRSVHWRDPSALAGSLTSPRTLYDDSSRAPRSSDLFDQLRYLDFAMELGNRVLARTRPVALRAGVHPCAPLLDRVLVEQAWALPMPRSSRESGLDALLKRALARYVPSELVHRPAQSTGQSTVPPLARWLAGPLRPWAEALLSPAALRAHGLFDPAPIRSRWSAFIAGETRWLSPLWTVLMFQAWYERHMRPP